MTPRRTWAKCGGARSTNARYMYLVDDNIVLQFRQSRERLERLGRRVEVVTAKNNLSKETSNRPS